VETDLHITGKVAQFGRGIMDDVSKKLMNQFATNLNTMLDQPAPTNGAAGNGATTAADTSSTDTTADTATPAAAKAGDEQSDAPGAATTSTAGTATSPGVRKINGPAAAPIELSDVAGSAILKRALPLIGGVLLLWIVVRRLRRR